MSNDIILCRYIQLASIRDLLSTRVGVDIHVVSYFLEEWRNEMWTGLHCLLNTKEGAKLSDAIDVFYRLARTRFQYS